MAKAAETSSPRRASNRRRAPRRDGRRTTLTLPTDVLEAASGLAEQLDTSVNDAVVRLAVIGAQRHAETLELDRRARRRRESLAAVGEDAGSGEHPSEQAVRAAVLALRAEE